MDTEAFEELQESLLEIQLLMLSGKVWPKPELSEELKGLLGRVVATIAVVDGETPRAILEQARDVAPTDEAWREESLPARRRAADERYGDDD